MASGFLGLNIPEWIFGTLGALDWQRQDQEAIQGIQDQYNAALKVAMGIVDRGTSGPANTPSGNYPSLQQLINQGTSQNVGNLRNYEGNQPTVGDSDWWFGKGSALGGLGIV